MSLFLSLSHCLPLWKVSRTGPDKGSTGSPMGGGGGGGGGCYFGICVSFTVTGRSGQILATRCLAPASGVNSAKQRSWLTRWRSVNEGIEISDDVRCLHRGLSC